MNRGRLVALGTAGTLVVVVAVWAVSGRETQADLPPGVAITSAAAEPAPTGEATDLTGRPTPSATASTDALADDSPPVAVDEQFEPAVPLDAVAPFASQVTARLVHLESIDGDARGPGEVAGPAVRLTVELVNTTEETFSLGSTVVNAYTGVNLAPAEMLSGNGSAWFAGSLDPGASASAVYVFAVPADERELLRVTVSYDPVVPTLVFEGTPSGT